MTNRIGPVDPKTISNIGNRPDETGATGNISDTKARQDVPAAPAPGREDTVELTSGAQLLERLEKSLDSMPAIDSRRIAEVKAAIENGDYEIDSVSIADAMIRLDRAFGE